MKTDLQIIQETLKQKLYKYVERNNPDILNDLGEVHVIGIYIENKVAGIANLLKQLKESNTPLHILEDLCMEKLTKDLKPSRYNYIMSILEENFEFAHQQLQKSGILEYEVSNMIACCEPLFQAFGFTVESEDNRQLKHAVIATIDKCLCNTSVR